MNQSFEGRALVAQGIARRRLAGYASALLLATLAPGVQAVTAVGEAAPALNLRDVQGRSHSLSEFKGRIVVVEWFNPNCPFVQKHYNAANMQGLQQRYMRQGVVWLTVSSTNPTHHDYLEAPRLAQRFGDWKGSATALLMDDEGRVAREWGAKTTPHMFIVDAQGRLAYAGGIDDRRSTSPDDVKGSRNHVAAALDEMRAGKTVSQPLTRPYGCSIKY